MTKLTPSSQAALRLANLRGALERAADAGEIDAQEYAYLAGGEPLQSKALHMQTYGRARRPRFWRLRRHWRDALGRVKAAFWWWRLDRSDMREQSGEWLR